MSSANLSTLLDMSSSKSFIYIKNSIGPNSDPCGTPLKTDFQFEISPSTITLCLLCVSHFSIQLITSAGSTCLIVFTKGYVLITFNFIGASAQNLDFSPFIQLSQMLRINRYLDSLIVVVNGLHLLTILDI